MQAIAAGLQTKENTQKNSDSQKNSDYQERVVVNKATMDFMISHMPIKSRINSVEENKFLTEAAICMLDINIRDFALGEKIMTWLFEHIDDDEDQAHNGQAIAR